MMTPESAGVFVAPMIDGITGERHYLITSLSSLTQLHIHNVIIPGSVLEGFVNSLIVAMAQQYMDEGGMLPTPCYTSVN